MEDKGHRCYIYQIIKTHNKSFIFRSGGNLVLINSRKILRIIFEEAGVASSPSLCIPNEQVTTSFWVSEVVNIDGRWYYVYANNMMKKNQVAFKSRLPEFTCQWPWPESDDICDLWGVNTVEHILVHCSNPVISSAQGRWRRMHHLQNKSVPH